MNKIITILLLVALVSPCFAETIYLKDGSILKGKITKTEGDLIYFQTGYSKVQIKSSDVQKIIYDDQTKTEETRPVMSESDSDFAKKMELYKTEEKNAGACSIAAIFVPSLGHALAGDWKRSVPFLVFEGLSFLLAIQTKSLGWDSNYHDIIGPSDYSGIAWTVFAITKIFEVIDAGNTANDFNKKLKQKYGLTLYPVISPDVFALAINLK